MTITRRSCSRPGPVPRPPPPDTEKHQRLDAALDKLQARYGREVIYYGSVRESRNEAPMRISFTHIPDAELEGD